MFSPRARRKSLVLKVIKHKATIRKLMKRKRSSTDWVDELIEREEFPVIERPPKGFSSWEHYWLHNRYGPEEYHYQDVHLGNGSFPSGRIQLQKGGINDTDGYGYTGAILHGKIPKGYDRTDCMGIEICMRSLDVTLAIQQAWSNDYENTDKFVQARIIVALDNQAVVPGSFNQDFANARADSTLPRSDCLMANGLSIYSHYNLDNTKRYTVLYDRLHEIECGAHNALDYYKTNEDGAGHTAGALKTKREVGDKLYQFNCEYGDSAFGDEKVLAGGIGLTLDNAGTMDGTGPGINVIDTVITNVPFIESNVNFGKTFVVPGVDGDGHAYQEQADMFFAVNPIRHLWRRDTSEWTERIHIDFDETYVRLEEIFDIDEDKYYGYFADNCIYLGIQVVSRTDATLGLWADSRLTWWQK